MLFLLSGPRSHRAPESQGSVGDWANTAQPVRAGVSDDGQLRLAVRKPQQAVGAHTSEPAARLALVRRFLAIFMLVVLPFQFSWAAAASYCAHESSPDAAHFGHHEHQHHADGSDLEPVVADEAAGADAQDGKASGGTDLDCGQCHSSSGAMQTLALAVPAPILAAAPSTAPEEFRGAHAATRPERPQWRPLA